MDVPSKDMKRLESIMAEFSLHPVMSDGDYSNPIDRLIFCQVLAEKYPIIITNERTPYNQFSRTNVRKFLGYKQNTAIKYQLREGAIDTIKGYKDYYHKYKVVKAAFLEDKRYLEMLELKKVRDESQEKMNELMKEIITE